MSADEEKPKGHVHQGADHSAPYPVSRLAPPSGLVDLAQEIERADDMLKVRTTAKLRVIAEQMKALQAEARRLLAEAQRDTDLNHARCNFQKVPGKIYHLYREAGGRLAFSMLSPEDWGGKPPQEYRGAYRLEADLSWTPAGDLERPDETGELVQRLLHDLRE
jgi:hypothetical protein